MTPQPINPIELANRYNNLPEILFQLKGQMVFGLSEEEIIRNLRDREIEEPEYENDNEESHP